MTPEERDLITGLFARLKSVDQGARDEEADALIGRLVATLPAAPYLLTQTVLVQEHALTGAQTRIAELERDLAALKEQAAKQRPPTSFLGGLLGGGRAASPAGPWGERPAPDGYGPQGQPYQRAPVAGPYQPAGPMMAPSVGGGFLSQALTTAAGVAGGALLFEGISGLLHQGAGPFSSVLPSVSQGAPVTEIVNNYNYYGSADSGGDGRAADVGGGAAYQPAPVEPDADPSVDDGGFIDDPGFGDSGGDDWA